MSTVLITGASKGIGKGFTQKYLARPNTTVVAAIRDPAPAVSKALEDLPKAKGSNLIIVKIESTSDTDAANAIKSLSARGIDKLDVVIANAGIYRLEAFQKVADMKTSDLLEHVDVNAAGTIRLFQAVLPLLQKATKPKFLVISSGVATLAGMEHIPFTISSYGASKTTINFLTRRIHFENEDLIAFAVHPGAVQTDEGNAAARFFGLPEANTTVNDSVNGLVHLLDGATREETSGKFWNYDGAPLVW